MKEVEGRERNRAAETVQQRKQQQQQPRQSSRTVKGKLNKKPFGCGRKLERERECERAPLKSKMQLQSQPGSSSSQLSAPQDMQCTKLKSARECGRESMRVELKLKSALRRGRGCNLWRWQRCFFFGLHCGCSRFCKQRSCMHVYVCVWRRHLTAKCREMRCVAALRCSAAGPPIDPSFYYRECASVQVCTRTHTCITFICMYVNGKNRPWVWAVATLHVHACPCMHTTLYFMWFFFAQFSHIFLTLVAVRKRETEIDVAKISFFPFLWLTICWRKLWIWFVVFVVVANEF